MAKNSWRLEEEVTVAACLDCLIVRVEDEKFLILSLVVISRVIFKENAFPHLAFSDLKHDPTKRVFSCSGTSTSGSWK
jgi:hypothetical protein